MAVEKLDEKGFIFLDEADKPYLCRMIEDAPWLCYWHEGNKCFVTLREVNQTDIWNFPKNLTEQEQNIYREVDAENAL